MSFKNCTEKLMEKEMKVWLMKEFWFTSLLVAFVVKIRCSLLSPVLIRRCLPDFELLDKMQSCGQKRTAGSKVSGEVQGWAQMETRERIRTRSETGKWCSLLGRLRVDHRRVEETTTGLIWWLCSCRSKRGYVRGLPGERGCRAGK